MLSDPDPDLSRSVSFCRIRIHETVDDMDPDLVTNQTQIMGKYLFLLKIFYFHPNQIKFSVKKNMRIKRGISNLGGGESYVTHSQF